jgi:hypothetical protein
MHIIGDQHGRDCFKQVKDNGGISLSLTNPVQHRPKSDIPPTQVLLFEKLLKSPVSKADNRL